MLAVLAGAAIAATTAGAAASLGGVTTTDLSVGTALVASCDGDGVGLGYTTSAGIVQSVTVTDVAAACSSGQLWIVLADASGASIGAGGPVTVSGASVAVALTPQPPATSVAAAHIAITGP